MSMDSIDKALRFCETGERPAEEDRASDEPMKIYAAIETLRVNNSYYFLQWWVAAKEFQRSKLTRSGAIPNINEGEGEEIKITVVSDSPTKDES